MPEPYRGADARRPDLRRGISRIPGVRRLTVRIRLIFWAFSEPKLNCYPVQRAWQPAGARPLLPGVTGAARASLAVREAGGGGARHDHAALARTGGRRVAVAGRLGDA